MMRWLRGLGALTTLAAILFGAPVLLAGWGRYPSGWPAALGRPDDGSVLLVVLTAVGWLAWAAFTAATAAEAARLVGGRRFRLPLLGGLQRASAGLLLAVLALAPTPAADPVATPAAVAALPDPGPAASAAEPEAEPAPAGPTYVVAPGDDLWTISERLLGDGGRWRELVAANPERLPDPTSRLTPGTRLALPAAGASAPLQVDVRRGDTLSGLALEHLGAAGRWPRIAAANADLIDDPDHIEVGWRLVIPGAEARREPRSEPAPGTADDPPAAESSGTGADGDSGEAAATPDVQAPLPTAATPRPASDARTETAAEPSPAAEPEAEAEGEEQPSTVPLLGALGALAAAAIIGALETRRALQLRERPIGRRLIPPDDQAARLRSAIGGRRRPDRLAQLDAALREIGRYHHQRGLALPALARIVLDEVAISFEWAGSTSLPPAGFDGTPERWTLSLTGLSVLPSSDHPCPYPAVVSLGTGSAGEIVLVDAERSGVLGVAADEPELQRAALAAMAVELACAPWAAETTLVVVGDDAGLVLLAGGERVRRLSGVAAAAAELRRLVAERRAGIGAEPLATLRADPDRAAAVAPVVFCFLTEVEPELAAGLDELLADRAAGVAAILGVSAGSPAQWQVGGDPYSPTGRLAGTPGSLLAHSIPESTRSGVSALFRAADEPDTLPAPWWSGTDDNVLALPQRACPTEDPVDIVRINPATAHPQVLLIGPAELRGGNGPAPSRSRQQLVELCAWLLEHPGSTATAMAAGLAIAEGTRRSNLSRLRNWLGEAPDGRPYLPDAYSGRILLHPGVSSDWDRLLVLLRPGIDRVDDSTLIAALELVRGAPLADAAPGQWRWAEELRTDISSALRDVGVVLAERALTRGNIDLARWAAARALVVAPEDEQLLCARIRTEHRAGNTADVERLVNQVTRQARILGVDLLPETVLVCQQAIEGRTRVRRA